MQEVEIGASFPSLTSPPEDPALKSPQKTVAPPQSSQGGERDTSKVLQELERVRHGIQVFAP